MRKSKARLVDQLWLLERPLALTSGPCLSVSLHSSSSSRDSRWGSLPAARREEERGQRWQLVEDERQWRHLGEERRRLKGYGLDSAGVKRGWRRHSVGRGGDGAASASGGGALALDGSKATLPLGGVRGIVASGGESGAASGGVGGGATSGGEEAAPASGRVGGGATSDREDAAWRREGRPRDVGRGGGGAASASGGGGAGVERGGGGAGVG